MLAHTDECLELWLIPGGLSKPQTLHLGNTGAFLFLSLWSGQEIEHVHPWNQEEQW